MQTGDRNMVRAGAQSSERALHRRVAKQGLQSFADSWKYHAWLIRIPREGGRSFRLRLLAFAYFLENGRCRIARAHGNRDDAAASGFHFFAADDLVARPIAALYQNIGKQARNHFAGSQIIEDHHAVHGLQRRENFRALAFWKHGTAFPFQLAHTGVAIQSDNQGVPQFARQFEDANMARMEQIKAAVGENDSATVAFRAAKPQNRLLECED